MDSFLSGEGAPAPHPARATYAREVIDAVWQEADPIEGNDPELWRKDGEGNWIRRLDYGRRNSEFGWEIVDRAAGLFPVHWQQAPSAPDEDAGENEEGESADGGMLELF